MEPAFQFCDDIGPAKIIHLYEPSAGLKAILVVDNISCGPSIGGLRMAEDVSTDECFRLARAMTLKNAAAGIPHGGGKSVIFGNPRMPKEQKEKMIRAMAQLLRNEESYIFGPDMGTNEECMAWVRDEIGRAVGLPKEMGGIPLDELGATGWGLCQAVEATLPFCDFELAGARIVVQGFGSVGQHAARFLVEKGARLVACNDSKGGIVNPEGLDVETLITMKKSGVDVSQSGLGRAISQEAILDVECEIWIPAARPDVINETNLHRLNTRLIAEGANIPVTSTAEETLYRQGVLYIPDFIANAGGVICGAIEYRGGSRKAAFDAIAEKIYHNTEQVMRRSREQQIVPRKAANQLALERLHNAMKTRRFAIYSTAPGCI